MLATFHWEQGRLLWECLRLPEAQTLRQCRKTPDLLPLFKEKYVSITTACLL